MRMKFWSWIYRVTGYTSKYIVEEELDFIHDNLNVLLSEYLENIGVHEEDEIDFQTFVCLKVGMRQLEFRLYRPWKRKRFWEFWK